MRCSPSLSVAVAAALILAASAVLEVHIVPHSHDDVGWLITPDQYYTQQVRNILTTTVDALLADKTRTFVEVEQYFFNRWWQEQNATRRQQVHQLVQNGQFEFINGGWSMHDEACVHMGSAIDNMAVGNRFIKNEFNVNTRIGWHIDPFGHASATPRLMAQMGFDAFFFWRTDYQLRDQMEAQQSLESVWRSSKSLGNRADMFTSIMFDSYCSGCTDSMCGEEMLQGYIDYIKNRAGKFRTNHQLVPWGCDFAFQDAHSNFAKMDALMKQVNSNASLGIHMFYSTATRYIDTLHSLDVTWPVNEYDYYIDSDDGHSYWSGFFVSRSAYKGYERSLMAQLHAVYQLHTVHQMPNWQDQLGKIQQLREAMGVGQHHDAITGTEKQFVRDDYQMLLAAGQEAAAQVASEIVGDAVGLSNVVTCPLANISSCPATNPLAQGQQVTVAIQNPLGWTHPQYVSVPVPTHNIAVTDVSGNNVPVQVVPTSVVQSTADNTSPAVQRQPYIAVFRATVSGFGVSTFVLKPAATSALAHSEEVSQGQSVTISSDQLAATFGENGLLQNVTVIRTKTPFRVSQNFGAYCPYAGNGQKSGAYIFRTCQPNEKPVFAPSAVVTVNRGPLFEEVVQTVDAKNNVHQIVRLYQGEAHATLIAGIGELDPSKGQEYIIQFSTDLATKAKWYQDSEGLEVQERVRDSRPNYNYTVTEPVAGNFFPFNTHTYLASPDANAPSLVFITDRSRASASLADGEIELLVHRRLLADDSRGVAEPLNENTRIITTNLLAFPIGSDNLAIATRDLSTTHTWPFQLFYSSGKPQKLDYAPMANGIPGNVQLLTFESSLVPLGPVIIRLRHLYAVGEHSMLSNPVTVDLDKIFVKLGFSNVVEQGLNADRPLSSINRLQWKTASPSPPSPFPFVPLQGTTVVLNPMDIRTFTAEITRTP